MIDYCDQEIERKENPHAKEWFKRICLDDSAAFDFLWRFWCFEHCYDDLVDQDKPCSIGTAAYELAAFIHTLSYNPFYLKHRDQLFPLMIQALNAWVDGDRMKKSKDSTERLAGAVVSCTDVSLAFHVAFLVGGWSHMRSLSDMRQYDPADPTVTTE